MNNDGAILGWNKGAERQTGYKADEAIGRNIDFMIAPVDKDRFWQELTPAIYRDGTTEFDVWAQHRSGRLYLDHSSASVVRDPDGRVIGAISCNLDVKEKFRAEEALRASEQRLAGILNMAPEAVITIDTEQL